MTAEAMRARYVTHAVRHTRATPVQLADYLAGFRARGQGAWPSQIHLAKRFHVSTRTIQRWLCELATAGLLVVERSKPRHDHITGRWRRRTNRYRCTFRKSKRPSAARKDQLTPTRHPCRNEGPIGEPCSEQAPEQIVAPPWLIAGITAADWTRRTIEAVG